jgi:dipeptidase
VSKRDGRIRYNVMNFMLIAEEGDIWPLSCVGRMTWVSKKLKRVQLNELLKFGQMFNHDYYRENIVT